MKKVFKSSKSEKIGLKLLNKKAKNILSIGISTGGSAEINMLKKAKSANIIATTLDNSGIQFTNKMLEYYNCNKQITTKIEDVSKPMPYENNYFDYVYARLVLHYLNNDELNSALLEINRVTKVGGKFFVVVRTPNEWELKAFPDENIYDTNTGFTEYWFQGKKEQRGKRNFIDKEKLTTILTNAGFNIVKLKHIKEFLYINYERTVKSKKANDLIWCLAEKL